MKKKRNKQQKITACRPMKRSEGGREVRSEASKIQQNVREKENTMDKNNKTKMVNIEKGNRERKEEKKKNQKQ